MKARVPKVEVKPVVLLYGFDGEKREALTGLFDREAVPYKEAGDGDLWKKTGHLCGIPGFLPGEEKPFTPFGREAMIFCGFGDGALDRILKLLRENGLRVDLKAALTPTNQNWPLGDLLTEIGKEHEEMSRGARPQR